MKLEIGRLHTLSLSHFLDFEPRWLPVNQRFRISTSAANLLFPPSPPPLLSTAKMASSSSSSDPIYEYGERAGSRYLRAKKSEANPILKRAILATWPFAGIVSTFLRKIDMLERRKVRRSRRRRVTRRKSIWQRNIFQTVSVLLGKCGGRNVFSIRSKAFIRNYIPVIEKNASRADDDNRRRRDHE